VIDWCADYARKIASGEAKPFMAILADPPYHLTSITERFGKEGSAPAKGGVYNRAAKGFMGKTWDGGDIAFQSSTWAAINSVASEKSHML
jgi:site-specific DNA-methyltransferase (adenine-specific)